MEHKACAKTGTLVHYLVDWSVHKCDEGKLVQRVRCVSHRCVIVAAFVNYIQSFCVVSIFLGLFPVNCQDS